MDISLPLSNVYHYGYKMTIEAKWIDSFHTGGFMGTYSMNSIEASNPLFDNTWVCKNCGKDKDCVDCDTKSNSPWISC
jgi:hypothetical protein